MAIGDKEKSFIISGTGDVLEPEGDVIGIGSGGNYALASAKVLMDTNLTAEEIAKKLKINVKTVKGILGEETLHEFSDAQISQLKKEYENSMHQAAEALGRRETMEL